MFGFVVIVVAVVTVVDVVVFVVFVVAVVVAVVVGYFLSMPPCIVRSPKFVKLVEVLPLSQILNETGLF